jgi:DNA-binding PucR family transcriptional regulator
MKHLRKFNESWIEDMYNSGRSGGEMPAVGPGGYVDKTTPEDRERHDAFIKSKHEEKEKVSNFNNVCQEFRMAVNAASKNADPQAHQKMIDLLDEYGVDLIKDRRYLILKKAAEMGKEEVMDVLLDALRDSGEDMTQLNKSLEEYVRNSRG